MGLCIRRLTLVVLLVLAAGGCGGTSSYTPYLSDAAFGLNGRCIPVAGQDDTTTYDCGCYDSWRRVRGDFVRTEVPDAFWPACESRLYYRFSGNRLTLEHYNVFLPCFPEDVVTYYKDRTQDPSLETDEDIEERYMAYFAPITDDAYPVIAEVIQLTETVTPASLTQDDLCSYNLFISIEDMEKGAYDFKLWRSDRSPLPFTDASNQAINQVSVELKL